jgi:L-seryl-tRNA(Ser) seleniumtransferase
MEGFSREAVVDLVRAELVEARRAIADGGDTTSLDQVVGSVEASASARWRPWPGPVINATGVVLHTNLGRSPLSAESIEAVRRAAAGYSDLELDLESGTRGSRQAHASRLLSQLTGAEAALVVNNNASAIMLGLAAVASGKEVIVSRGEAVEIGGGFRIPDVLRQSGATLVEVGTTNRTYARDYESALGENTGAILSVHSSNFRVTGFTHTPEIADLVDLGGRHGIPVLHDLGSGCLLDTTAFGMAREPIPQDSVRDGIGLAFFSGDKLLGGPQAGIIVGTSELVGVVSRHPLARAVRVDKLSLAGLVATLLHYVKGDAERKVPIWRMVALSPDEIRARALRWGDGLGDSATLVEGLSTIGGGSLPGETLPTWLLCLSSQGIEGGPDELARRLRSGSPPVVGRIEDDRLLLDPRTVLPEEDETLVNVVREALS